jgi:predicted metalloprotease with PDZ domain
VMRALWENFGKAEIGFTPEDLKGTIEGVAGFDLTEFFTHYLHGLEDLPFQAILADFGLRLDSNLDGGKLAPYLGMRTAQENGRTMIKSVANGSPAELAGLDAGDELLAIDGLRVNGDQLTDRLQQSQPGDVLEFTYFHQDELLQSFVKLAEPEATQFTIVPVPDPTPQQQHLFEGWLGMPLSQLSS